MQITANFQGHLQPSVEKAGLQRREIFLWVEGLYSKYTNQKGKEKILHFSSKNKKFCLLSDLMSDWKTRQLKGSSLGP